tara:strand:+ start:1165 stop:1758 length:594 start_codon:yes stop_codon:yes gene_type:complete
MAPLWGATDSDESKPKNLTTAEKRDVYATSSGWVRAAGTALTGNNNTSADPEVLVAIGELATSLGQATVSSVRFNTTEVDASAGGTLTAVVEYNEQVTVATAAPILVVTNSQAGGGSAANFSLAMDGSLPVTNDTLTFSTTLTGGDGKQVEDDVLSIAAQNINLNGGTIVDTIGGGNAELAISAAQGSAAGTLTVVA